MAIYFNKGYRLKVAVLALLATWSAAAFSTVVYISKAAIGSQDGTKMEHGAKASLGSSLPITTPLQAAAGWKTVCQIASNITVQDQGKGSGTGGGGLSWAFSVAYEVDIPGYSSWSGGNSSCYVQARISAIDDVLGTSYEGSGYTYKLKDVTPLTATKDFAIAKHADHFCAPQCGGTTGVICP